MNKRTMVLGVLLVMAFAALVIASLDGDQVYFVADKSPAVWLRNTGSDKITITTGGASGSITCLVGAVSQVFTNTEWDTVAALETKFRAVTNASGYKVLEVYRCTALGTETTDDELLDHTAIVLYAGDAGAGVYWDTSDVNHYRVYIPPKMGGHKRGDLRVRTAYGNAKGTGSLVTKAYLIENSTATEKFMNETVSPTYISGGTSAAGTSPVVVADNIGPATLNIPIDMIVGSVQGFLLSVDRTACTTGGVGVRTDVK